MRRRKLKKIKLLPIDEQETLPYLGILLTVAKGRCRWCLLPPEKCFCSPKKEDETWLN
jgi:hypothetical protein